MGSLRLFAPEFSAIEARKQQRGWEGAPPESDVALHGVRPLTTLPMRWCHVWVFFFFFWDSCRLGSDFLQNGPIWPESGRIGRIKLYWPTTEIGLESCLNNRNRLWMRPKHLNFVLPQFYSEYLLLLLCFLFRFVNQGHSNVFFKNVLIVKI